MVCRVLSAVAISINWVRRRRTRPNFFNDVKVPKENLLGEEGMGFIYLMRELPQERLSIAVSTMAMQAVIEQTVNYVKERKAFGKALLNFRTHSSR